MTATNRTLQRLNLIQELDLSVSIIESGLAALQASRPYKTRHFVFLMLLSSGVERLLKVILHLHAVHTTGQFLTTDERKRRDLRDAWNRHDLVRLCAEAVAVCFTPEYLKRPVAVEDRDFIRQDATMTRMLELLADFARHDRYVFMDGIAEPGTTSEWPDRRWGELESLTLPQGEYARLVLDHRHDLAKQHANRALVACLERFLRALARLFTLSELGSDGRMVSTAASRYWRLSDQDLGTTRYEF